jgi:UDP-N-acetylmuramyl tripeptide synthase
LQNFKPAFGRGEKISFLNKNVQVFLSKNPTSFNESLDTIRNLNGQNLLLVLNDRIPDGLDVSWIWDINFENLLTKDTNIAVSGDRVWDMTLRLKHAGLFVHADENLKNTIEQMCKNLEEKETLYILANYSAMLESRKILTGKKIL